MSRLRGDVSAPRGPSPTTAPRRKRRRLVSDTDAEPPEYLDDRSFREPHRGPKVPGGTGYAHLERDPSPAQIRRMCEAIPRPDPSGGGLGASDD